MLEQGDYRTLAGIITGAHGVQGSVKVKLLTPTAAALITPRPSDQPFLVWLVNDSGVGRSAQVLSAKRPGASGPVIVRLADVNDRTAAELLAGYEIYAPETRRLPLDEDEYFVEDLIGLRAVSDNATELGKIVNVLQQPANDVYETDLGALIPAVKQYIIKIDIGERTVLVRDDPGLLAGSPAAADVE